MISKGNIILVPITPATAPHTNLAEKLLFGVAAVFFSVFLEFIFIGFAQKLFIVETYYSSLVKLTHPPPHCHHRQLPF